MLKKTIKYTDYNGNERTEDFYFNLNEAELLEMDAMNNGLEALIQQIISEQNSAEIMTMFKTILLKSVGKKSLDGRRFEKSEEISKEFSETEAYTQLFVELASDADAAADFIKGILPDTKNENDTKALTGDVVEPAA